jgi:murein DD-endopeptidase MepM/ murein hydrolase activator NlpD
MSLIVYFLKVSVALVLFWLMYRLVFKKLTFFAFNRFFLIGSVVLSFTLPLIRLMDRPLNLPIVDYSFGIDWEQIAFVPQAMEPSATVPSAGFSLSVVLWIYFFVAAVLVIKGMFGFLRVRKRYTNAYMQKKSGITYYVNRNLKTPFTIFRTIYLDPYTFERGITPVIRHEMVHARQLHSVDLLFMEFACAFLWFNPFVFLFRRCIRDNHEYLADDLANENRSDLIHYMQTLSETLTRSVYPVYASYFTSSTLKKRIIMLTNKKSRSYKKFLYLLIIPLVGLAVMSFQQPVENVIDKTTNTKLNEAASNPIPGDPAIPSRFPLDKNHKESVTLNFGWEGKNPVSGEMMKHKGIDLRAPIGTPVYATADGVIGKATEHDGYGKVIVINHGDTFVTLYAHLDEILVDADEKVKIGDKIGTVGNTGKSTGPHLHYEVRKGGDNVDPADYF